LKINQCYSQLREKSYLAANVRVDNTLCDCTSVKHKVKRRVGNWAQEQMLVAAASRQQIHVTVVNDGERRILNQDPELSGNRVR
jgi:hypothetical protein